MRLSDNSASTLTWLAVFFLLPGFSIQSPSGRFLFVVLAAFVALIPLAFGNSKRRVISGLVLVVALLGAFATYPEFDKDQNAYRERVRQKSNASSER